MKNIFKFGALAAVCVIGFSCNNSSTSNYEAEFYVRGNCGMCEERIEKTINNLPGVRTADYIVDSKLLKVSFDSTKTNEMALHKAVAATGHETKEVAMDEKAHDELPECCKKGFEH